LTWFPTILSCIASLMAIVISAVTIYEKCRRKDRHHK
jgi:hypothetical protein